MTSFLSIRFLRPFLSFVGLAASLAAASAAEPTMPLAIYGDTVHTLAGAPLRDGLVLVRDGKITYVGPAAGRMISADHRVLRAAVVTPGLIDARATVGLSGLLNQPHDQEQREKSAPLQPELRALDAFDARDGLVPFLRSRGITTVHTGHGPGAPITGQTFVVKTHGRTVEADVLRPAAMIAATLGPGATTTEKGKAPGTSPKVIALLRADLIKAQEYATKRATAADDKKPARDLRLEALGRVLDGTQPLLVTAHRATDILAALRLAQEFSLKIVLEGCADAPLVLPEIKASGFSVLLHPTMARTYDETANASMTTAAQLAAAGIPFALTSGYEDYVPKTRVVLYEAAVATGYGLSFDAALAAITRDAARLTGVLDRVGTLETGKDGDIALWDGNPLDYTTHCTGTVIDGLLYDGETAPEARKSE